MGRMGPPFGYEKAPADAGAKKGVMIFSELFAVNL